MMTPDGMEQIAAALVERGYSRDIAERYAALIGDTIEEENGKWVVRDEQGAVLDRIDPIE